MDFLVVVAQIFGSPLLDATKSAKQDKTLLWIIIIGGVLFSAFFSHSIILLTNTEQILQYRPECFSLFALLIHRDYLHGKYCTDNQYNAH